MMQGVQEIRKNSRISQASQRSSPGSPVELPELLLLEEQPISVEC